MFKYICLFFLFSFTATNLDAENRHTYFHHINTHHGLASNNVYSILQDSEGFLWFATANGLSRYDGYTFKTFKEIIIDTDTVRFSIIRSLYEDRDGIVWIGTEKSGLIRYDRLKESFTYFNTQNSPLLSNKIYKVYQDKNLNYWIGTSTGLNVVKYENQKLISVDDNALSVVPSKLKKEGVKAIYEDKEGHIWIGTLKGNAFSYIWDGSFYLLRYNVSMSEVLNHNISRNINSIIQTKDGILWFAFWGGGLWCYNKLNDEFYNYFEKNSISLHSDIITDLAVRENELYFSSWNDGLYKLNIETNNLYNWRQQSYNPYGLGNNELRTVMIDNRGNVFTGASSEAGVNVLLKQSLGFKVFRLKTDNLEEDITVQHFEPDGMGNLYISTKSGVYVRKLNNSPCIDVPLPLNKSGNQEINIRAYVSCYDSLNNLLWIGTEGNGLAKYNFATQTVYFYPIVFDSYTDTSLSSTVIMDLYLDSNKLWIGSWSGGLSMLNIETERFIHYEIPNTDYSTNVVIDIEPENDSVLWLATFGKGILRYSKKTNTAQSFFYTSQGKYKGEGTFLQIKKASDGKIWAGTLNSGVIRFDYLKKDFQIIDFTDNQTITSASVFVEDNNNNMWIGCNQGLLSVNQKLEVEVYSHNIGLLNNSYPVGAGISLDNNKIWISGNKNILEFVPENVVVNDYEEKPIITNLIINNENADLYTNYRNLDTIELDYYQNSFSIQFSTMNFINKKAVSYKYMLEGIDSDWKIISSPERSASYTNLPAGVYTFVLYANCPKNG